MHFAAALIRLDDKHTDLWWSLTIHDLNDFASIHRKNTLCRLSSDVFLRCLNLFQSFPNWRVLDLFWPFLPINPTDPGLSVPAFLTETLTDGLPSRLAEATATWHKNPWTSKIASRNEDGKRNLCFSVVVFSPCNDRCIQYILGGTFMSRNWTCRIHLLY